MTRSNLYITLSNGKEIIAVADNSSAPEQGYFVEQVLLPLFSFRDAEKEMVLLREHCTMDGLLRLNADYRYDIDLCLRKVDFCEEKYDWGAEVFRKGKYLNDRLRDYLLIENDIESYVKEKFKHLSNQGLIDRANALPNFKWDDEGAELVRRQRVSGFAFDYTMQRNTLIILRDKTKPKP
ncbi:hypothetical protein [Mucilaginibacter corticis]|uniref:hypothetical protein n=1 Tax=Mucilaginibacter corticis TaxID=2597670 RepID=UPI0016432126|nr:hypothetical protein [Mucilaginibacter corticis]